MEWVRESCLAWEGLGELELDKYDNSAGMNEKRVDGTGMGGRGKSGPAGLTKLVELIGERGENGSRKGLDPCPSSELVGEDPGESICFGVWEPLLLERRVEKDELGECNDPFRAADSRSISSSDR